MQCMQEEPMDFRLDDARLLKDLYFKLLPIQILLAMVGAVNGIISGLFATNFVGSHAMTAIGLFTPVFTFLGAVMAVLVGGSALLCGKYMGNNHVEKSQSIFSVNFIISFVLSLIISVLLVIAVWSGFTGTMTQDPMVLASFNRYLLYIAPGIFPMLASGQLGAFLSLENQSRRNTVSGIAFIGVNTLLHFVFVAVLHMEAAGLALASTIGAWIFMCMLGQYFFTSRSSLKFSFRDYALSDIRDIFVIGYPGALGNLYQTIRALLLNGMIQRGIGSAGISAFTTVNSLLGVFWAVPGGMLTVSRMLIGISIGEEDRKSLIDVIRICFFRCVPIQTFISVLIAVLAVPFTMMYYQNPAEPVFQMTVDGFRILPFAMPFAIIVTNMVCYAQASEKNILVHVLSVLDGWINICALSGILIPFFGMNGVYWANVINGLLCVLVILIYATAEGRKFPRSVEELMAIPKSFGVNEDERVDIAVHNLDEVVKVSQTVGDFCRERGIDRRRSFFASLALEEMAGYIVANRFHGKPHTIDIRVTHKEDDVILRIKDDCEPFNPEDMVELVDPDDPVKNMGIKAVYRSAKSVQYQNILGLNVLTMRI